MQQTLRVCSLFVVLLLALQGCGGRGDTSGGGSDGTTASSPGQTAVTAAAAVHGTVSGLPSALLASGLQVSSSTHKATVASDGSFAIGSTDVSSTQFMLLLDADGDPLLAGFVSEGSGLSPHSTAEVLIYLALSGFATPPDLQKRLRALIASLSETQQLADAIERALRDDPKAIMHGAVTQPLTQAVMAIKSQVTARKAARTAATATPPSKTLPASKRTHKGLLINPARSQSGVDLNQTGLDDLFLTNHFRRRGWVFIDQNYYVQDEQRVTTNTALTDFELPPTAGVADFSAGVSAAGSVLAEAIFGVTNGQPVAYTPISTEAVTLPLQGQLTHYTVTLVGPGLVAGDLSKLSPPQIQKQLDISLQFVLQDLAIPYFANVVLPNSSFTETSGSLGDLIGFFGQNFPNIAAEASRGEVELALYDIITAIRTSQTVRDLLFEDLRIALEQYAPEKVGAFMEKVQVFSRVTGALSLGLTLFDGSAVAIGLGGSMTADQWGIDVVATRVDVTPATARVPLGDKVDLTATIPANNDAPTSLVYKWTCSGTVGTISDGSQQGTHFDSSHNGVTYMPGKRDGIDSVRCDVFGLGPKNQRIFLGSGQAVMTVPPIEIKLSPPTAIIYGANPALQLVVAVTGLNSHSGARYHFRNTAAAGTLTGGDVPDDFTTVDDIVTYTADPKKSGADMVSVQVTAIDTNTLATEDLGTASSQITVNPSPSPSPSPSPLTWEIVPRNVTLTADQQETFGAIGPGGPGTDYSWSSPSHGGIVGPGGEIGGALIHSPFTSVTFHPDSTFVYVEQIEHVGFTSFFNGQQVGHDSATIKVHAPCTVAPPLMSRCTDTATISPASPRVGDTIVVSFNQVPDAGAGCGSFVRVSISASYGSFTGGISPFFGTPPGSYVDMGGGTLESGTTILFGAVSAPTTRTVSFALSARMSDYTVFYSCANGTTMTGQLLGPVVHIQGGNWQTVLPFSVSAPP